MDLINADERKHNYRVTDILVVHFSESKKCVCEILFRDN